MTFKNRFTKITKVFFTLILFVPFLNQVHAQEKDDKPILNANASSFATFQSSIIVTGDCETTGLFITNNTPGCTDGPSYDTPLGFPDGFVLNSVSDLGVICFTFEKIDDSGSLCNDCAQLGGAGHAGANPFNGEIFISLIETCSNTEVVLVPVSTYSGGYAGVVTLCFESASSNDPIPKNGDDSPVSVPSNSAIKFDAGSLIGIPIQDDDNDCGLVMRIRDNVALDPLCVGNTNGMGGVTVGPVFCSKPPAELAFDSNNELMFGDPCSCDDPRNCNVGGIDYFHDTLTVTAGGVTGLNITATAGATDFFTSVDCFGGSNSLITAGTVIPETPAGSGEYKIEFWRPSGATPTISVLQGGVTTPVPAATFQPVCTTAACNTPAAAPIPTMNEWGLMIFGLLVLNLSVFFVQRRELA